jgi:uncharacterized protein (TIGR02680 family)
LDGGDRPLTRKDLIASLGADAVRDSPDEYRQLVDATLFALGPARYEQMLDLVLTLRKPQLAKDLNPVELSRTLQRGLRPIEDHLLVEAARAFDDMEAVARTLEGLVAADSACAAFLTVYATYLRTHARAAADALTSRRADAEARERELTAARSAAEAADTAVNEAETRVGATETEPARLRARLDRLKSSAAYRSHEQLADVQRHAEDLATAWQRADAVADEEGRAEGRRRAEWERALVDSRDARTRAGRLASELAADAEAAGIPWTDGDAEAAGLAARLSARSQARRADVQAVRAQADRHAQAERERAQADEAHRAARAAVDDAAAGEAQAETAVRAARQQTLEAVRRWAANRAVLLAELDLPELPEVLTAAIDGPSLKEVYADAVAAPVAARRGQLAALAVSERTLQDERSSVMAERDRIAAERDDAPLPSPTRPAPRSDRTGAPLWRVVRFADGVSDVDAAGIEAALHAAGLLDAWVHPTRDDTLAALAGGAQDAYLRASEPVSGPSLADVLVAEAQEAVPAARIEAILASIALDELSGVAPSGRWAQGSGLGQLRKDRCEYIGATARAVRRAARIAECDRGIAELDEALAGVVAERTALHAGLDEVQAAAAVLPPLTGIAEALRILDRATVELRVRREAADAAAAHLDAAIAERAAAEGALRRVVAERSLPVDRLEATASAVDRFDRVGVRLEDALRAASAAGDLAEQAADRHAEAVARLEATRAEARAAYARSAAKDEELHTLRGAIGAEATQVLADVARATDDITAAERALTEANAAYRAAIREQERTRARVDLGGQAHQGALAEARHEALRLRPYAHPDLLGLIRCPTELRWPALDGDSLDDAVVALHEAILAATRELPPTETSLKQSATRLTTALAELQAQLPAAGLDHRPEWDTDDGIIVVRVADEQGMSPVAHFAERITRERRDQEQLLTEAEQQVFEDALLGQLAGQIHQRTIESRDLVDAMDTHMQARRMSSGLTVGVGWRLADDLDPDQRDVCKLLERNPARLGPAELVALRRHFAARIRSARSATPEKPYRDLLAEVLDYRLWRIFAFTLHRPGGTTEPLTRARHSQLSGGEQSVSLHLPLFAAANALFGSARPEAPRLLGLDEAFAGVDDNGCGELMSLAKQFDLDLLMTGYDLWATHPAVTGCAHYDLSHSAVDHTVSTVLLVWDGAANVADFDGTLARALGSPETRRAPAPVNG